MPTFQGSPHPMIDLCSSIKAWSLILLQDNFEDQASFQSSPCGPPSPSLRVYFSSTFPTAQFCFFSFFPHHWPQEYFLKKTTARESLSQYPPFNSFPSFRLWHLWGEGLLFANSVVINLEKDSRWPLMLFSCVAWTALFAPGYHTGQHSSGPFTVAWHLRRDWTSLRQVSTLTPVSLGSEIKLGTCLLDFKSWNRGTGFIKYTKRVAQKLHWQDPWEPDTLLPLFACLCFHWTDSLFHHLIPILSPNKA